MSEFILPFHVPAGGGVTRVREDGLYGQDSLVTLVVVSGGPVFIWSGIRGPSDAQSAATSGTVDSPPDWDLAANANQATEAVLPVQGEFMAWSNVESFGHLRVRVK